MFGEEGRPRMVGSSEESTIPGNVHIKKAEDMIEKFPGTPGIFREFPEVLNRC